ncbi:hypothetical protein [uncultured Lacinutrix sp.]|uniref:DUF6913 domain-containing protein n=1 Tax=uncultured Lacinutrix sp. TaxID=574032 RepID=UPI0026203350|nr:hypothetical protein [uncultured Lacinutrix sp.]
MILKGFKEKSNEKYINRTLNNRLVSQDSSKIKKIGVLVNKGELIEYKWFEALAKTLKVKPNDFQLIIFTKEKKIEGININKTYNENNIGWNGVIKDPDLKRFLDTDFDIFISYYTEESISLKLLTAASKAKFKVGVLQDDERLNDLIIKTKIKDLDTFKSELMKYLTVLNKI